MSVPTGELRKRLLAVKRAAGILETGMLDRWCREYPDGHLTMDFEEIEDSLMRLSGAIEAALLQTRVVVALAADEDSRYWDAVREMAA